MHERFRATMKEAYFYCLNHLFRVYIPLVPLFNATLSRVISQRISDDVLKTLRLYSFPTFERSDKRNYDNAFPEYRHLIIRKRKYKKDGRSMVVLRFDVTKDIIFEAKFCFLFSFFPIRQ